MLNLKENLQVWEYHINVVKEWKKSEFLTRKAFHISHNSGEAKYSTFGQ